MLTSMNGARAFAGGAPDTDAPGHAHALHVGGAARVDGDDPVALLLLEEPVRRPPGGIRGEGCRPDRFEDGTGHPEAGHLADVRELRALVGARTFGVGQPEVPQAEQTLDLGLDVDVGQQVARVGVLAEWHAVAFRLLAVAQQPVPDAIATDATAGAMLQLEMGTGRLPAVVLSAH